MSASLQARCALHPDEPKKLQVVRDYSLGVLEGFYTGLYVYGPGGTSKSYTILDVLRQRDAHFVLVDNPTYHAQGDMGLEGSLATLRPPRLTYANIALFAPRVFAGQSSVRKPLFPWAFELVERQRASAEHYGGRWYNVGTPQDLAELDAELQRNPLTGMPL